MNFYKRIITVLAIFVLSLVVAFSIVGCSSNVKESTSVTFIVDNSIYSIVKIREGNETLPDEPTKELYKFDGWYEDKTHNTKFKFDEYLANKDREDIVVYAGFTFNGSTYKVTLNGNGGKFGTDETKTLNVREKDPIDLTSVTLPQRENYVLSGWSTSKNGSGVWNFNSDVVTADTVLYAVWSKVYNITFDANGGSFTTGNELTVTLIEGEDLSAPEEPTRNNYDFMGWATTSSATESDWDLDTDRVIKDLTLYAVWQDKVTEYDVEFVLNYSGAKNETKSTVRGLIAYEPEREGYIFNGWWYSDGEKDSDGNYILTTKVDLTQKITTEGVKVYASWINLADICVKLSTPSLTASSDGTITWSESKGAVRYNIVIWQTTDSNIVDTTTTSTTYDFSNSYHSHGTYYVKVRAIGDGYTTANSNWSSSTSFYYKRLSSPTVTFDLTTSTISWTSVKYASTYSLYIDNVLVESSSNLFEYSIADLEAGTYQVKVTASTSGYADGTTTATVNKLRLKAPQVSALYNKNEQNYTLRWDAIANADKYYVTINGGEAVSTTNTYYNISKTTLDSEKGLSYKVEAFDSKTDYLISDSKTYKLGTPTEVTINFNKGSVSVQNVLTQTCKVTFDSRGGSSVNAQTVTTTSELTYPSVPTRSGYLFTGWYEDISCTKIFDFSKDIFADTTLYAGWFELPTTGYNSVNSISIIGNYNSSSSYYTGSSNNTSSSLTNRTYFSTLASGSYTFYYRNRYYYTNSNYAVYFYVYNLTQGTVILTKTSTYTDTYRSVSFDAEAGDVIYVENYRYSTGYNTDYNFYVTGGKNPTSGGSFNDDYLVCGGSANVSDGDKITAGYDTVIELTASYNGYSKFLGWYIGDTLISESKTLKYTVNGKVTLTAKWE